MTHIFQSPKQYHIAFDDCIVIFDQLYRNQQIADMFQASSFLKELKDVHDLYGTCFHMVCFYEIDSSNGGGGTIGFNLSMCPDKYKAQFQANASWLRFGFHGYRYKVVYPDPTDTNTWDSSWDTTRSMITDYRLIRNEIIRICGIECWTDHMAGTHMGEGKELQMRQLSATYGPMIWNWTSPQLWPSYGNRTYYQRAIDHYQEIGDNDGWYDEVNDLFFVPFDGQIENITVPFGQYLDTLSPDRATYLKIVSHEQRLFDSLAKMRQDMRDIGAWCQAKGIPSMFPDIEDFYRQFAPTAIRTNYSSQPKQFFVQLDECVEVFRDLHDNRNTYTSIFQNQFLALLKEAHDLYGAVFTLSTIYSSPAERIPTGRYPLAVDVPHFNLSMMTDQYKAEFQANAHWLRAAFHSYDIAYPYTTPEIESLYSTFSDTGGYPTPDPQRSQYADCEICMRELERIGGKEFCSNETGLQIVVARANEVKQISQNLGIKVSASWGPSQLVGRTDEMPPWQFWEVPPKSWETFSKYMKEDAVYLEEQDYFLVPCRILIEDIRRQANKSINEFAQKFPFERSNLILVASHDYLFNVNSFEPLRPTPTEVEEMKQCFRDTFAYLYSKGYRGSFPSYDQLLTIYRPDLAVPSVPTITRTGRDLEITSKAKRGTNTPKFQISTDGIAYTDLETPLLQAVEEFDGLWECNITVNAGIYYIRCGVSRNGQWYYSDNATVKIIDQIVISEGQKLNPFVSQVVTATALINGQPTTFSPLWSITKGQGSITTSENGSAVITPEDSGTMNIRCADAEDLATYHEVTIDVIPFSVVMITPKTLALRPGQKIKFGANVYDKDNNPAIGVKLLWSSMDEKVASVDQTGLVTAKAGGTAKIKATVVKA